MAQLFQTHRHQIDGTTSTDKAPAESTAPVLGRSRWYAPEQLEFAGPSQSPASSFPREIRRAMDAMQMRNSRRLLAALRGLTELPVEKLEEALAAVPRTTISELFRCLDPHQISLDNDPTFGYYVGVGMWQQMSLATAIDAWGGRAIYSRILLQLSTLLRAMIAAGHTPSVNDYVPLLRAAGLASDPLVTKILWEQMRVHGIEHLRHSNSYHEFVRARFLVHPAYYGFDKTRVLVSPRNLHRRNVHLIASVSRLDRLRKNLRRRKVKFGLNRNVGHEDISRVLRKPLPVTRVFYFYRSRGFFYTEELLCSFIIAFARSGSVRFIQHRILEDYFGVIVKRNNETGAILVEKIRPDRSALKNPLRPTRPVVRPSSKLMHAIVYAYCSNGYIGMGYEIIKFIAKAYRVTIPQKVWSDMLEWCHILTTPPTSTAWRKSGFHDRIPVAGSMQFIWQGMTSKASGVQPGFKEYDLYIRNRLVKRETEEALELMQEAHKMFYEKQCAAYDSAAFDYAAAHHAGVDTTKEVQSFQRHRFRKSYMRERMQGWVRMIEKKFQPEDLNDPIVTQRIPELIRAWRDIYPNPANYRTASGMVSLLDPAEPVENTIIVRHHKIDAAMKRQGQWTLKVLTSPQYRLLSRHSVGDLTSTRRHPLEIWKGIVPKGRPRQSRRIEDYLAWEAYEKKQLANAKVDVSAADAPADAVEELPAPLEDIWDDDD
ncbi:hypothetical protein KJ359_011156 [Pestalotiopsis sp. 9143b]|nr:hypothetical protein KJ359_011156 [Pestalotiopsis sp. 9143b]